MTADLLHWLQFSVDMDLILTLGFMCKNNIEHNPHTMLFNGAKEKKNSAAVSTLLTRGNERGLMLQNA